MATARRFPRRSGSASPAAPTRRRSRGRVGLPLALAGSALLLSGCGGGSTLNGAGASFPAPLYQRWFQELAGQGIRVNYQSVGSGAGVRQFVSGTVDFAASDVPMKAEDIAQVKRGVLQIPMTAGAIAVAYNHQGCTLSLSQKQLVDIFLGRIRNFSELGCSAQPITVVHRSDGSGTTANFTAHLSAISPEWKAGPGESKSVTWPTGVGAKGNEGVAAQLSQIKGGIGYVESAFVRGDLQAARLTNAAGEALEPTTANAERALASIDLGADLTGRDANPSQGYPIVTFSWILLYQQGNGSRLETLQKVFDHTLSEKTQAEAPGLGYVNLPSPVLAKARAALQTMRP
ncbi:phosphate ABC transporter substrate-binding protein PstS [Synechococcus sp. CBW1004]|jgi:phosphate transport system substrate-binding protein|uniref:phosphate ABC transporter substrate-binding protein PstS n=1 Tax=Synechococcus sp. CBW1004 TaxID=1353136 RepID=UPI0018CCAA56|nr:phosphate ABC transporter substrate-binding protein PstS [Synechococcus sp. CBW1004]QPN62504.1 phosphate ABC transporter substrate-binding protein PstS [Synechococcus sp. CBW1004]